MADPKAGMNPGEVTLGNVRKPKPEWNPSSVTLEDVQGMNPREFRTWNFLELRVIHKANVETKEAVKGISDKVWAALIGIVFLLITVLGEAIFK